MTNFRLGIIGGCLSHQPDIPRSLLYHRRLAHRLAKKGYTNLLVNLAGNFEHSYTDRLNVMSQKNKLDGVLVHVRGQIFFRKGSLIVSTSKHGAIDYYLHPFLLQPWKMGWAEVETSGFAGYSIVYSRKIKAESAQVDGNPATNRYDLPSPRARFAGIALGDVFSAAGRLVGLHNWAWRNEVQMLSDLRLRCEELHLPLFVMGPSRNDNYWYNRVCEELDDRLSRLLIDWSIPYCALPEARSSDGGHLFLADGAHFSSNGHDYIAQRLENVFEKWFDTKERIRQQM